MNIVTKNFRNEQASDTIFQGGVRLGAQSVLRAGTRYESPIVLKSRVFINVGVVLGRYTVIGAHTLVQRATIGSFCSIGEHCNLNNLASHPTDWLSTHPFQANTKPFEFDADYAAVRKIKRSWTYGPLTVGHDVWIGDEVSVLGGVTIGHGAIIGAKSFVNRNIPPYAIAAGVPARVKKFRFPEATIAKLLDLAWWDLRLADLAEVQFDQIDVAIEQIRAIQQRQAVHRADDR